MLRIPTQTKMQEKVDGTKADASRFVKTLEMWAVGLFQGTDGDGDDAAEASEA